MEPRVRRTGFSPPCSWMNHCERQSSRGTQIQICVIGERKEHEVVSDSLKRLFYIYKITTNQRIDERNWPWRCRFRQRSKHTKSNEDLKITSRTYEDENRLANSDNQTRDRVNPRKKSQIGVRRYYIIRYILSVKKYITIIQAEILSKFGYSCRKTAVVV